jgi:hypothetical protein
VRRERGREQRLYGRGRVELFNVSCPAPCKSQGPATQRLLGHYWLENSPLSPLGVVPTANVSAVSFGPVAFLLVVVFSLDVPCVTPVVGWARPTRASCVLLARVRPRQQIKILCIDLSINSCRTRGVFLGRKKL